VEGFFILFCDSCIPGRGDGATNLIDFKTRHFLPGTVFSYCITCLTMFSILYHDSISLSIKAMPNFEKYYLSYFYLKPVEE
jgi:hypothetical protein